ncbi:MAG: HD domain-containing protein [Candidatus Omnitrophica bacterium]|nr:HD domain-containing protein [Candidatus Omnitrophota bacterium]
MSFLKSYPQIKIIKDISKGKKVKVYLVGGYLRDHFLGVEKTDFDFAVSKDALKIAKLFAEKIKGAYVLLDEERECARVAKKVRGTLFTFDFAGFRAKTFLGDLSHRDFTINTFSVDLDEVKENSELDGLICDLKKGLKDLEAKTIKMTSAGVFKEDPLRMLRAFSLQATLGFKIEAKTTQQIIKDVALIRNVSAERIREELFKFLGSEEAAKTLKQMHSIKLLEILIPQIRVMFDCKQGAYHHLDVWPHSLETVVQFEKLVKELESDVEIQDYLRNGAGPQRCSDRNRVGLIKLAALLHDIGKPDTRKKEGERLSFHAHERVGKNFVREISKNLKLSTKERFVLEDLVFYHLRPGYLSNYKKPSDKMVYRFFRDAKEEVVSVLLLSLADQRSTRGELTSESDQKHHEEICFDLIKKYFEKKKEKPFVPFINGNDVMKALKIKPSPLVGKILNEVIELQNLGKVKTKKEALAKAKLLKL